MADPPRLHNQLKFRLDMVEPNLISIFFLKV